MRFTDTDIDFMPVLVRQAWQEIHYGKMELQAPEIPWGSSWCYSLTLCFARCLQLVPKLTRNFLKEGYMEKTGPRASNKMCTLSLLFSLFAFVIPSSCPHVFLPEQ